MTENIQAKGKGKLYTVAAPSGVGKTSLVKALVEASTNLFVSISFTTRPRRPNEVEGFNYHFVDEKTFKAMISHGDFLEYALVFHHYYGTSKRWVEQQLACGRNVILEIDWQGVRQVKELFPNCVRIFILPPSLQSLKKRLEARGQDSAAIIAERMAAGKTEISHYQESDFLVVNDDFAHAVNELQEIITGKLESEASDLPAKHQLAEQLLVENYR